MRPKFGLIFFGNFFCSVVLMSSKGDSMTIIQFNPNNLESIKQPQNNNNQQYFSYDYPEDSFEFVDYDLDEIEEPTRRRESKSIEIKSQKERRKVLGEAWGIYYRTLDELNEMNPKAYYKKGYSTEKDNHFEICKYSGKGIFGSYKTKEVFVFKNDAPVSYSKYKIKFSYQGRDSEGFLFGANEILQQTCDFLS